MRVLRDPHNSAAFIINPYPTPFSPDSAGLGGWAQAVIFLDDDEEAFEALNGYEVVDLEVARRSESKRRVRAILADYATGCGDSTRIAIADALCGQGGVGLLVGYPDGYEPDHDPLFASGAIRTVESSDSMEATIFPSVWAAACRAVREELGCVETQEV